MGGAQDGRSQNSAAPASGFRPREGRCQCGRVRYRILRAPLALAVCHCGECQRQSGSAFGMSLVLREEAFELLHGELRDFTRKAESGRSVRCTFCPECGTRIYHDPSYAQGLLNLKPGTLDDTSWLSPSLHAWTRHRQSWVRIPDELPSFDGQPG